METGGDLAKLHLEPFQKSAHCSVEGAFVDNVPLLRRAKDGFGGEYWVPRRASALDLDLGSGYCLEVDSRRILAGLRRVADCLNNVDFRAARRALADLGLPAFPQRTNGRLNDYDQSCLAKVLGEISLLKWKGCVRAFHTPVIKYNPGWPEEARDRHGRWAGEGEGPIVPVIEPYSPECLAAIEAAKERCIREYALRGGGLGFAWMRRCIRSYVPAECGY